MKILIPILIILIIYIITIFISRHFTKLSIKIDKYAPVPVLLWFIPIFNIFLTFVFLVIDYSEYKLTKINKFTGKYW